MAGSLQNLECDGAAQELELQVARVRKDVRKVNSSEASADRIDQDPVAEDRKMNVCKKNGVLVRDTVTARPNAASKVVSRSWRRNRAFASLKRPPGVAVGSMRTLGASSH